MFHMVVSESSLWFQRRKPRTQTLDFSQISLT